MQPLPFEVAAGDGIRLRGQLWEGGVDWVVMVHDIGGDLDRWLPLVSPLLKRGYTVASIDLRGHGASDGDADRPDLETDLSVAVVGARERCKGVLVVIAEGAAAVAALTPRLEGHSDGLVLFSPRPEPAELAQLRGSGTAKLFFVGAADAEADRCVTELRNRSIGAAGVISFATTVQGTDLLQGPWRQHVIEQVVGFLDQLRSPSATATHEGGNE
jgi:pimeloyl-ACP methyl ester carboxylesterase